MATTKKQRRTPSADAFRVIAEYTYDWETWVDARGITQWINPAVQRITGYSVRECLAHDDYPLWLVHPADRIKISKVMQRAARGEAGNDVEFRVRHKDGRIRWVAVSWQAMRDAKGRALGYRTSVRDIDDRKRMERQMMRLRQRAERAALARSELLANVSHELRSPAHCIAGFVELLSAADLQPREQRHLRVIADQAEMMQRHVEDLLQAAALDVSAPRITVEAFDLRALLDSLADAAQLEARSVEDLRIERAIALDSAWVMGDRVRVSQVVRNLLDNALKFTSKGSIRLCASRDDKGAIVIEVRDTGIGMTAAQVRNVTQPFYQADTRSVRRHAGVGLGLSIVERLTQAMDGQLVLKSRPNHGTSVQVRLPLPATDAPIEITKSRALNASKGVALVVDDTAAARELMVEWLRALGWQAVTAASGHEALASVRQQAFDVVLLDYQMPDLDGVQTALQISELKTNRPRPFLALVTANAFVQKQLGRARPVIDQVLVKPITSGDLQRLLLAVKQRSSQPRGGQHEDEIDMRVVNELLEMPSSKASHLLAQLLPQTCLDQANALHELGLAVERRDRDGVERAAHQVAGLAGVVGARWVAQSARDLMERTHQKSFRFAAAGTQCAALVEGWARAQVALEAIARG